MVVQGFSRVWLPLPKTVFPDLGVEIPDPVGLYFEYVFVNFAN